MKKFENIQPDIITRVFTDWDNFRQRVKDALEDSRNGGYRVDSDEFVRGVIGREVAKEKRMTTDEFGECKKEIMKMVGRIKKEEREKQEREERAEEERKKMWIESSKKAQLREWKRTGVDPEKFNEE